MIRAYAPDICNGNLMLGLKHLIVKEVESFASGAYCLTKFEFL